MYNTRKIIVGEVRQPRNHKGKDMYVVLQKFEYDTEIMWITGKLSGIKQIWHSSHLTDDMSIM